MLHIILMFLRIAGWILLAVLGLLVLVFLFALFTPLRYRTDFGCRGKLSSLNVKVRFHILFHLVSGAVFYEDKKLIWNIRAAWIKLGNSEAPEEAEKLRESAGETGDKTEKEAERPRESAGESEDKTEKEAGSLRESAGEAADKTEKETEKPRESAGETAKRAEEEAKKLQKSVEETVKKVEETAEEAAEKVQASLEEKAEEAVRANEEAGTSDETSSDDSSEETVRENEEENIERDGKKNRKAVFEKIKYTFSKICDKIKVLSKKAEMVRAFLENEAHQLAFWKLAAELKKLLLRMKPKKLQGELHFGFEDPSLTGRVQAVLSMLYPCLDEMNFYPDFENKVLDGEVSVQGAARLWPMAAFAWNMVWSRDVRRTVLDVKKLIRK